MLLSVDRPHAVRHDTCCINAAPATWPCSKTILVFSIILSTLESPNLVSLQRRSWRPWYVDTGLYTPYVYVTDKAVKQLGVDEWRASLILSVLGVSNTLSRILTGLLVDCPRVDCMIVHNVAAVIAGAATCLVSVLDRYDLLLVYAAVFGVFIGQSASYAIRCRRKCKVKRAQNVFTFRSVSVRVIITDVSSWFITPTKAART